MKRLVCIIITLLSVVLTGYAQMAFEKGYFIDNSGVRTECEIRNMGWRYNPVEFEYRLSADGVIGKKNISEIQEFRIEDARLHYMRFSVDIDRSDQNSEKVSAVRNPEFSRETLFLKVVVKGGASLYAYEEFGLLRFFYAIDGGGLKQLIYKQFYDVKRELLIDQL